MHRSPGRGYTDTRESSTATPHTLGAGLGPSFRPHWHSPPRDPFGAPPPRPGVDHTGRHRSSSTGRRNGTRSHTIAAGRWWKEWWPCAMVCPERRLTLTPGPPAAPQPTPSGTPSGTPTGRPFSRIICTAMNAAPATARAPRRDRHHAECGLSASTVMPATPFPTPARFACPPAVAPAPAAGSA